MSPALWFHLCCDAVASWITYLFDNDLQERA